MRIGDIPRVTEILLDKSALDAKKLATWSPPQTVFVETTYDNFWASRLDSSGTSHTNQKAWPGITPSVLLLPK